MTDPPYNVEYVGKTADALTIQNDNMSAADFYAFAAANTVLKRARLYTCGIPTLRR